MHYELITIIYLVRHLTFSFTTS